MTWAGAVATLLFSKMAEEALKLANVQTKVVGVGESRSGKVISLNGKVQADERLAASQVAHVPERIDATQRCVGGNGCR